MPVSDGKTFGLLRTNHKLTGNVKISVDQKNNIFLNSFDANSSLSDSRFKKQRVNPDSKLSADLYKFFDKGTLSKNIIFDTYRKSDDKTVKTEFWRHYEQQYTYGVSRCDSQLYDEQYCFLAPIWLDKEIPKYFIVFRNQGARTTEYERNPQSLTIGRRYRVVADVNDPLSYVQYGSLQLFNGDSVVPDEVNGGGYIANQNSYIVQDDPIYEEQLVTDPDNFLENVLSPADIVAVFDLSENTVIGRYLRRHVNDPLYTNKMVNVDFVNNKLDYTGIDIKTGVITTKSEQLDDLIDTELNTIDFDEYVTLGFERNSLLSSNLLNLEFMFDDNKSDDYTFNRYYGFYCNDIDLGKFFVDKFAMFNKSSGVYYNSFWNKDVLPYYYGSEISDEGGIKIIPQELFDQEGYVFRKEEIKETPSIFYIKDKYGSLYKVDNFDTTDYHTLNIKELDSEVLFGFNKTRLEIPATKLNVGGQSNLVLTVNSEVYNGYKIEFYYRNTLLGRVIADTLPDVTPEELELIENDYSGDPTTPYGVGENVGYYFHPNGTPEQIAEALRGAIDYLLIEKNIDAINIGDKVILRSRSFGAGFDQYSIKIVQDNGEISYDNSNFSGGSDRFISRVRIDKDYPLDLSADSFIATTTGFAKIRSISAYLDEPVVGSDGSVIDYNGFEKYVVINLVDEAQEIKFTSGTISAYNNQKLTIGVLSLYDLKDFDFDFYTSTYNRYNATEYKKYFDIQEDQLIAGQSYTVYKQDDDPLLAQIEHDGVIYNNGDQFYAVNNVYQVISGNPIIVSDKYYNDEELQQFQGFQTLVADQNINLPLSADPNDLKNKARLFTPEQIITEYSRLKEVEKSSNILKSRIIPYINKWVLKGGKNIRDIDYRFNVSKAFGEMNFSPSFNDELQDPAYFTHEWYYLSSIPELISDQDLIDSTSYFNRIFDVERLKDIKKDYFLDYFTLDSHILKSNSNEYKVLEVPTQRRYTTVNRVSAQNFETFFKGVKVKVFSENVDYSNYKFSVVLNLRKSEFLDVHPPFEIKVYDNRDHKNMTVLIDIVIDDYKILPDVDKKLYGEYLYLYVMNSLKRWNDVVSSTISAYGLFGSIITVPDDVTKFISAGDFIQITDSDDNNGVYEILTTSVGASGTDITISGSVPNPTDLTGVVRHFGYKYGLIYDYPDLVGIDLFNSFDGVTPNAYPVTKFRGYQLFNTANMNGVTNPNVLRFDGSYILLNQQMKVNQNGVYGKLIGVGDNNVFVQTSPNVFFSPTQYIIDKPNTIVGVDNPIENDVLLQNNGMAVVNIPFLLAVGSYDPIDVQNSLTNLSKLVYFHETGGLGVYSDLAKFTSFGFISDVFNEDSKFVNYRVIENGEERANSDVRIRLFEPSVVERSQTRTTSSVNISFPELPSENIVDYEDSFISENTRYLRYGGNFVPKFKNVMNFKNDKMVMAWGLYDEPWSEIDHTWNEYRDGTLFVQWSDATQSWFSENLPWDDLEIDINNLNQNTIPFSRKLYDLNTRFDTSVEGFGVIDNYFYHKVAPNNPSMLALENPIYPSVGEIAIEKRPFNIFKSDFDPNLLEKYIDKDVSESVYGSFSKRDFKTFLGTKLLKIEKEITHSVYNSITQDVGIEDVQYDIGTNDLVYEITQNQIVFRLSLRKKMRDYIFANMESEFKKFVNEFNTTDGNFNDAINSYIDENILTLYEVIEVKPYVKKFNQLENPPLIYNEVNELIALSNGYVPDKNAITQRVNNLEIIIKYNVNTESNYSFNLRIKTGS